MLFFDEEGIDKSSPDAMEMEHTFPDLKFCDSEWIENSTNQSENKSIFSENKSILSENETISSENRTISSENMSIHDENDPFSPATFRGRKFVDNNLAIDFESNPDFDFTLDMNVNRKNNNIDNTAKQSIKSKK